MHLLMDEKIRVAKTDCKIVGEFLPGEDTPYLVVIDDWIVTCKKQLWALSDRHADSGWDVWEARAIHGRAGFVPCAVN